MVLALAAPPIALWVIPVADLGGVARHVGDVVRAGLPGYRLVILCPPGPLAEVLTAAGAAVIARPFGPAAGLRNSVRTLTHTVSTLRPDVVHSHLAYADIVTALVPMPGGTIRVTTEHGIARGDRVYHDTTARSRLMEAAHAARLRRFDVAIAVSAATRAAMIDKWHGPEGIVVIPNGVDRGDQGSRRPGLRILSVSRLSAEKRLPDLVEAFAHLRRVRRDATLTLAGTGTLARSLTEQVTRLRLTDAVTLPGHVDPGVAMREADVVAQLSVWENCSYTLLDTMAAGLGVVATDVGGNPEILPPQCLVSSTDPVTVAAALLEQGTALDRRPALADGWPSVAQMTARIAAEYDRARGSDPRSEAPDRGRR